MIHLLSMGLLLIGALFMCVSALGVVRMPDTFLRLHCSTKAATVGVGCVMVGAALHFGGIAAWARALEVVVFLCVTAPVAGHIIGRAAHRSGAPLWSGTVSDALRKQQEDGISS